MEQGLVRGSVGYRRLTLAMLFAGFSTFSLLYCVQPLLPLFAHDFGVSAEASSLAVSLATGPLAVAILFAGVLSDRIGRRPMMVAAMYAAGLLTVLTAAAPGWDALLGPRLLTGLALAGVPAVAMAYVSEEVDAKSVGPAMGLYIAGSGIGGMAGRLGVSLVTELVDWRWALAVVGIAGLALADAFRRLAPPSRRFVRQRSSLSGLVRSAGALFRDRALPLLFAEASLLMGVFVTIYNYAGFRLMGPPFSLSHAAIGAIFLLYLLGSVSSAWFGGLAERRGRRLVFWIPAGLLLIGVALTAGRWLPLVIAGIGVVTIGFFGAHSIASSWVGRRAHGNRGQAAAFYLFFYYLGSSVLGSAGGMAWTAWGWNGVVGFCGGLMVVALALAGLLGRVAPLPLAEAAPPRAMGSD
ncbi:MFS transporter [Sphingomonas xinjiangensis]|uniref:YNFM family putative membrane transporter n=1 Tax=Sphingomonas xinjiangensis TaxID=643568 RepID=A0A840YE32_9SPHN|nr:MFS transporter [Sphingomonas xinjiangensis]MBB5711104.1 YNFM family putative membrane transporter [Sphingomonas xinjiangensis]